MKDNVISDFIEGRDLSPELKKKDMAEVLIQLWNRNRRLLPNALKSLKLVTQVASLGWAPETEAQLLAYAVGERKEIQQSFVEAGRENAESAMDVIDYLMTHAQVRDYFPNYQTRSNEFGPFNRCYLYSEVDKEFIRNIAEKSHNPVELLDLIQQVINFSLINPDFVRNISLYIDTVISNSRSSEIIARIQEFGQINKLELDYRFSLAQTMDSGLIGHFNSTQAEKDDPILTLANLPDDEFEQILSPENIKKAGDFWKKISNGYKLDLVFLPSILHLVANPNLMLGIEKRFTNSELLRVSNDQKLIDTMISETEWLYQELPELWILHEEGFRVSHYFSLSKYQLDDDDQDFIEKTREELSYVMGNQLLRTNAKVLSRYGCYVDLRPTGSDAQYYIRDSDSARLEKSLIIMQLAGKQTILKYSDDIRDYDRFSCWTALGNWLDKINVDDVKKAFSAFSQEKNASLGFLIHLTDLIEGVTDIQNLEERISLVLNRKVIEMTNDTKFMSLVFDSYDDHGQNWPEIFKHPTEYLTLYDKKDLLERRLSCLTTPVSKGVVTFYELIDLSDSEMTTFSQQPDLLASKVDYDKIRKFKVLSSISAEDQRLGLEHIQSLRKHTSTELMYNPYSLYDPVISLEDLKHYFELSEQERQEVVELAKRLEKLYQPEGYSNVGMNLSISFCSALIKDKNLLEQFEAFLRSTYENKYTVYFSTSIGEAMNVFQSVVFAHYGESGFSTSTYINEDGSVTVNFLDEYITDDTRIKLTNARTFFITQALPNIADESKKYFYKFLLNLGQDLDLGQDWDNDKFIGWLVENRNSFGKYIDADNQELDLDKIQSDFVEDAMMTPELIVNWGMLTQVFIKLKNRNSDFRVKCYLRIAETLKVQQLQADTGVEEIQKTQLVYSDLYDQSMPLFERRGYFLLRNILPFTTNSLVLDQMKSQAELVESHNRTQLGWVHQAVHNYARAQTPEYIEALLHWLDTGQEVPLKKLALFYPIDSQPPQTMFSTEMRKKLSSARPDLEQLLFLTRSYYDVDPNTLVQLVESESATLLQVSANLKNKIQKLAGEVLEAKQQEKPENYISFLVEAGDLRKMILEQVSDSDQEDIKQTLLLFDACIDSLQRQLLPHWVKYYEDSTKNGQKSDEIVTHLIQVYRSLLVSGIMDGEIIEGEKITRQLAFCDVSKGYEDLHRILLQLVTVRYKTKQELTGFVSKVQSEFESALLRTGYDVQEAHERVVAIDMVDFEKSSLNFVIEPIEAILYALDKENGQKTQQIEPVELLHQNDQEDSTDNIVKDALSVLKSEFPIPKTNAKPSLQELTAVSHYISDLESIPYFRANKLCRILAPNYFNKVTGERQKILIEHESDVYALFPFFYAGLEGVAITKNDQIVDDPEETIKFIYKDNMVPAMLSSLREGD